MDPVDVMAEAFQDELEKIAEGNLNKATGFLSKNKKTIGLLGAGALGAKLLTDANRDRKMGQAMRRQQQY